MATTAVKAPAEKKIKIGFQGTKTGNCQAAVYKLAAMLGKAKYEYIPLFTAQGVSLALQKGEIDYGCMPFSTNLLGNLKETELALAGNDFEQVADFTMPVIFNLYVVERGRPVNKIYSHEQVLKQCTTFLDRSYPNAERKKELSSGLCAVNLKRGLWTNSAVICSEKSGTSCGLVPLARNIANSPGCQTTYVLFKRK